MVLDGKINDDPASGKTLYPIKAKSPCVDLSIWVFRGLNVGTVGKAFPLENAFSL
jgi:hypothetical protein